MKSNSVVLRLSGLVRSKSMRGAVWIAIERVSLLVIKLGSSLVMTRLLYPKAFGLMALLSVALYAMNMLSDMGINSAVIKDERGSHEEYLNTAWTLQIVRGGMLLILAFLCAPILAEFYSEPVLKLMLYASSLTFLFSGFNSMNIPLATRNLSLSRLAISRIISQLVSVLGMIIWAIVSPTVWALVFGGVVNAFSMLVLSHLFVGDIKHKFVLNRRDASAIFHFSKWIFFGSIAFLIASQLDRMLIGHYQGMAILGAYAVAITITEPVREFNRRLSFSVIYPLLNKVYRDDASLLKMYYYQKKQISDIFFIPAIGVLSVLSSSVIGLLYDNRYAEAGPILGYLCARLAIQCITRYSEHCLITMGHVRYALYQNVARAITVIIALPIGWQLMGMHGILLGLIASEFVVYLVNSYGLQKQGIFVFYKEIVPFLYFGGAYLFAKWLMSLIHMQ